MGDWYTIGLAAGLGAGVGVAVAGLLGFARLTLVAVTAVAVAAALGAGVGLVVEDAEEAVAGAVGAALAAAGALVVLRGALDRGGTAAGTAAIFVGAGLAVAALAFVPFLGYLEAVAVPGLAGRLLRRGRARYAGLRILARD